MSGLATRTLPGLLLMLGLVTVAQAQSSTLPSPTPRFNQQPAFQQPIVQQQGSATKAPMQQGSATKAPMQQGSATKAPMQGSATKAPMQGSDTKASMGSTSRSASIGLEGYCPVCVINSKQWVKGNPNIQASYDGKTYYFPSEEQRQVFLADPAKYIPVLGGDCSVCLVKLNKRVPGSIHHSALSNNRLYLFPSDKQKQMFVDNAGMYNKVDIAENGDCVVCRVEMNQQMAGKPEISAVHNGMRYQFISQEQRQMFMANPLKYTGGPAGSMSKPAGSMSK